MKVEDSMHAIVYLLTLIQSWKVFAIKYRVLLLRFFPVVGIPPINKQKIIRGKAQLWKEQRKSLGLVSW